jgi:hypothetical protein
MSKTRVVCLLLILIPILALAKSVRRVEQNVLISDSLPRIRIEISKEFQFLGSFPFVLKDIAAGERYVFVKGEPDNVRGMFVAQFESILPESTEIYRYSFDHAILIGGFRFRQNTFAFSFQESIKENPRAESAFTLDFLHKKKYTISDEWMASRFLTLGDETRRHELILFYMEPIAPTGHRLAEFYEGDINTAIWDKISRELDDRSRSAFTIRIRS